jgi:TetR/AcrR family transcriptional regulator, ethionamide resistance regulator
VSPETGGRAEAPSPERREEVRDQLLAAVEKLLAEGEMYAEISVDRLVAEAGIGRSTFYKYFSDKGDLLRAWFEAITAQVAGASAGWLRMGAEVDRQLLGARMAEIFERYRPHVALMATLYEVARYDPGVAAAMADVERRSVAELEAHIATGQREGWVDSDLLTHETAAWLSWLQERGQHQLLRAASEAEVARLVRGYTEIVWSTLYAFAPARSAAA